MKAITTTGILYFLVGISILQGCVSLGWDVDYGHKDGERILKKAPKITVVKREGEFISIKIQNNTGEDLTYDGYSSNNPPCFFKTKDKSYNGMFNNGWSATYMDMYWGGITQYVIKNGKYVIMKVKPMVKVCQIYIMLRSKADIKRFSFVMLYENKG